MEAELTAKRGGLERDLYLLLDASLDAQASSSSSSSSSWQGPFPQAAQRTAPEEGPLPPRQRDADPPTHPPPGTAAALPPATGRHKGPGAETGPTPAASRPRRVGWGGGGVGSGPPPPEGEAPDPAPRTHPGAMTCPGLAHSSLTTPGRSAFSLRSGPARWGRVLAPLAEGGGVAAAAEEEEEGRGGGGSGAHNASTDPICTAVPTDTFHSSSRNGRGPGARISVITPAGPSEPGPPPAGPSIVPAGAKGGGGGVAMATPAAPRCRRGGRGGGEGGTPTVTGGTDRQRGHGVSAQAPVTGRPAGLKGTGAPQRAGRGGGGSGDARGMLGTVVLHSPPGSGKGGGAAEAAETLPSQREPAAATSVFAVHFPGAGRGGGRPRRDEVP